MSETVAGHGRYNESLMTVHHHASHHHHDHARHSHGAEVGSRLIWALALTLGFAGVEALAGFLSGSLALLGDAGHMVTDSASLGLAAFAAWLSAKPPTPKHTFGLGRVETLAALLNVLFMVLVVAGISVTAVRRLLEPQAINGGVVTLVALVGLVVNVAVAWLLVRGEQTMNTRGALLHVLGDLLGSVSALVAGAVIYYTGWTPIDPLLSILICVLILGSSFRLLGEVLQALMEGVPAHVSVERIGKSLAGIQGVCSVHDLHVWTLSSRRIALSAHLVVDSLAQWPQVMASAKHVAKNLGVDHVTLQPESSIHPVRWGMSSAEEGMKKHSGDLR